MFLFQQLSKASFALGAMEASTMSNGSSGK